MQCCNEELDIDVNDAVAREHRWQCTAVTQLPIRPAPSPVVSQHPSPPAQQVSDQSSATHVSKSGAAQSSDSSNSVGGQTLTQQQSVQNPSVEGNIYWCVDRCWTEPSHAERAILDASDFAEDIDLFEALAKCYKVTRGFKGRFLSWKCCTDVAFVKASTTIQIYSCLV